jgi:hypothetical protein
VEVKEEELEFKGRPVTEPNIRENRIKVKWELEDDTKSLTYLVRYINDGAYGTLDLEVPCSATELPAQHSFEFTKSSHCRAAGSVTSGESGACR